MSYSESRPNPDSAEVVTPDTVHDLLTLVDQRTAYSAPPADPHIKTGNFVAKDTMGVVHTIDMRQTPVEKADDGVSAIIRVAPYDAPVSSKGVNWCFLPFSGSGELVREADLDFAELSRRATGEDQFRPIIQLAEEIKARERASGLSSPTEVETRELIALIKSSVTLEEYQNPTRSRFAGFLRFLGIKG